MNDPKERNKEGDPHHQRKKQQKVSLLKLFSFADFYDYLLMTVGSIGALVHGASVPVFFIFFGKLINIIGLAYLFPKEASHKVAKVLICFITLRIILIHFFYLLLLLLHSCNHANGIFSFFFSHHLFLLSKSGLIIP